MSPVRATLLSWFAVSLWNAGEIARIPLQPRGLGLRIAHHVVDVGHVLSVALVVVAGVALWDRFGPRKRAWSALAVAAAIGILSPALLSDDLAGALDRLFPSIQGDWFLPLVCVATGQLVTACFVAGRLAARGHVRWAAIALGLSLIVANDFVLKNGYPGAHVLLSTTGATLCAAALTGARLAPIASFASFASRRAGRRSISFATLAWVVATCFAAFTLLRAPSSGVQVELLARDTPLLFRWLLPLYAPSTVRGVAIPSELRRWFESRAHRPDIPPSAPRLLPDDAIVVMITIDALRSDLLDPRYRRVAPNLHAMRESSIYFEQARSPSTGTLNSLAAVFTGRHQSMLKWSPPKLRRRAALKDDLEPRFPELLQKAGVRTLAGMTISMLSPELGVARGFTEQLDGKPQPHHLASSDMITELLIDRFRRAGAGRAFYYTHFLDPHAPYDSFGKPVESDFEAYLIEVSAADANIGRIRRAISELGLKQRTALIVSADHGEGFGEHGIYTHDKGLYDVLVHVPLLIELPGARPRSVRDFVSVMDLSATVLDLFGVPTPGSWMAESLTPFLTGGRSDPNRIVLMEKGAQKAMLFPDGLKLMKRGGAIQLYDVLRDPQENENLAEQLVEEGRRRAALLDAYVEAHSRGSADPNEK